MPSDFRPFTKFISHLTIGISNLSTLPIDTFSLLPNLHSLSVRANILNLTPLNFKNASKLVILNFGYNNQIARLESGLFEHAQMLEYIDMGFNQITVIEDKAFRGLSNLKTLFLEANAIAAITNKTFLGAKSLQRLDLSKNDISDIETGSFAHMSKLKSIHLNQNRITRLSTGIFSGFCAIERIDLSVNNISKIDSGVFDKLPTLKILELGFNQLLMLPERLHEGVPYLSSLFMASNRIAVLQPNLGNLKRLTALDFSYNPIRRIDPEAILNLNHLETLEARGCNLTKLSDDVFNNKLVLKILDLSENDLVTVNLTVFRTLGNLRILKLEANKISEMENFTDIKNIMPKLEFINLSRNEIDCDTVPEMIEYFRNNTIEYEFGEEVDVGCQLLPLRSRAIQAYQLSKAKFNEEALRLINFAE